MPTLLQVRFEYQGILGLIVALIGFALLIFGFVKGIMWFWREVISPVRNRWRERRSLKKAIAFLNFEIEWLQDHSPTPVFVLDENRCCIFASDTLCRMLQVDSSDLEGKAWYSKITESELSRVLDKWEQAYTHKSRYTNVSTLVIGRQKVKFLVTAMPFIWNEKVSRFVGTLEPIEDLPRPKQLEGS